MAITVASPALTLLPSLQNAVLGAGLGLRSQTSTGTIASTNTATAAILGLANLQLSAPVQANPTIAGALGTLWTPKHLTISITNTSGETITGISLSMSDADATASADPTAYSYGQASDFPSAGIATGASALVTYTMLGPVRQYPLLTLTFGTAPTAGSVIVTTDLSGEGSAASVLKGSLALLPTLDTIVVPKSAPVSIAPGTSYTTSKVIGLGYRWVGATNEIPENNTAPYTWALISRYANGNVLNSANSSGQTASDDIGPIAYPGYAVNVLYTNNSTTDTLTVNYTEILLG